MNNSLNILKLTIFSLLAIILVGFLIILLTADIKFDFKTKKSKLVLDQNITEEFNKIDIDNRSLDIKFVKSADDTTNVKIYDTDDKDIVVNVDNNTLKIENKKKSSCMFFCFYKKRQIVVTLPEREYDLNVDSTSSDIESEVNFNNVNIELTSGDVELKKVGSADIKVTSGDVDVDEANSITINTRSGDVSIDRIYDYTRIETTSGDVKINDINLTSDSSIKVTSGDVKINNASENIYFNTSVKSGDVKINNNNRKAEYELNIKTTSGDIIVKN